MCESTWSAQQTKARAAANRRWPQQRVRVSVTGQSNRIKCGSIVDQSVLDPKWTGNGFPFNFGNLMRSTVDEAVCAGLCHVFSFDPARWNEYVCARAYRHAWTVIFNFTRCCVCVCVSIGRSVIGTSFSVSSSRSESALRNVVHDMHSYTQHIQITVSRSQM